MSSSLAYNDLGEVSAKLAIVQGGQLLQVTGYYRHMSTSSNDVTIYHNPACGTSRNTLALLRSSGIEPRVVEYLKTPPDRATLMDLLARTKLTPRELLREREVAKLGLPDAASWSDAEIIDRMLQHPILINRPIVVTPLGAVLSRPAETVLKILPSWRNSRD
jgi:arsenate reductase (glutaredoxin)